jgi:hypothetical protein
MNDARRSATKADRRHCRRLLLLRCEASAARCRLSRDLVSPGVHARRKVALSLCAARGSAPNNSEDSQVAGGARRGDQGLATHQLPCEAILNLAVTRDLPDQKNHFLPDIGSYITGRKSGFCSRSLDGETRTRTGDTTIFSRVLYQLSYLAVVARC